MAIIAGPGGYGAKELWRVGGPLSLAYLIVILVMVNAIF
jgi:di/tricarboxylate transporter